LLCTQIIKLYRLRNVCIVFKPQEVFKSLQKLRLTSCKDWESQMTEMLLDMYSQPVTDKKRDDTFVKRKIAKIENLTK
jgi:hypothetical protein